MTLLLLLLAAQDAPVIHTVRTPPPVFAPTRPPEREPSTIEVDVRSARDVLYTGTLRVAPGVGASFSRNLSEAAETMCLAGPQRPHRSLRTAFSLNLSPSYGARTDQFSIRVSWQRPGSGSCDDASGTRTVEIQQTVDLPAGEVVTVEGDAGLVVRLRRR